MKQHTQYNSCKRGIGLMAAVIIVAVIGVGGVAAVQVYNKQQASVDTNGSESPEQSESASEAEIESAKAEARQTLLSLRSDIAADLNANAEVALETLTRVRGELIDAYAGADAAARAELQEINAAITSVEARIEARSDDAADAITDAIATIESDLDSQTTATSSADADAGISVEEEGVKRTLRDESAAEARDTDDGGDTASDADAEASMDAAATTSVGDGSVQLESEASASGSIGTQ